MPARFALRRIAIVSLLFVSACAARNQPLDVDALRSEKAIVVLPAGHPNDFDNIDNSWGWISRANTPNKVPSSKSAAVDAGSELTAELQEALHASGWNVEIGPTVQRPEQNELLDGYGSVSDPTRSPILDAVIFDAGYISGPLRALRPFVRVWARLVDPASGKTLYAQRFIYGVNPLAGPERFVGDAEDRYYFSTSADLAAHSDEAVAGLRAGLRRIADAIAADLKRP